MSDTNDTRKWNDEPEEGYDTTGETEHTNHHGGSMKRLLWC